MIKSFRLHGTRAFGVKRPEFRQREGCLSPNAPHPDKKREPPWRAPPCARTADFNPNRGRWERPRSGFLDRKGLQVDRLLLEDPRRLLPLLLVVVQPRPGGDQLADDHVLLQPAQAVDL